MAFDKNQLVVHQLQVKAQRLEDGLRKFVEAREAKDEPMMAYAYSYALGCLGGQDLKKKLFKTADFERVVSELKEKKFMKADTADKNLSLWRVAQEKGLVKDEDKVAERKEESVVSAPEKTCGSGVMFGEVDEDGNIVPANKTVTCAYAAPEAVESKSGFQPSVGGFGGEGKRGPIYCY